MNVEVGNANFSTKIVPSKKFVDRMMVGSMRKLDPSCIMSSFQWGWKIKIVNVIDPSILKEKQRNVSMVSRKECARGCDNRRG